MAENNRELLRIISLLDDPDETVSVNAMAELLAREDELGALPALSQESKDPLMRRRIHQLQAALLLRRRRKYFLTRLIDPSLDFFDLLIDVHLQWFDNDSRPELEALLAATVSKALNDPPASLEDLRSFMLRENITAEADTTLKPENYCIGSIIQEHAGAASLLAGFASHLAAGANGIYAARIMDDFAVCDKHGNVMIPVRNWQISTGYAAGNTEPWELRDILRFASANLFTSAVNSDSFRYVLTIAQALSGTGDDSALEFFPYPFHPAE